MARSFIDDKIKLTWNLQRVLLPKNRVKLLLNMLILAVGTIPRGGTVIVGAVGEGETMGFHHVVSSSEESQIFYDRVRCN
jgi:histidine phosphotransferase ChpT